MKGERLVLTSHGYQIILKFMIIILKTPYINFNVALYPVFGITTTTTTTTTTATTTTIIIIINFTIILCSSF
jgi:hypothetical protein